jgi:hypothetical protein
LAAERLIKQSGHDRAIKQEGVKLHEAALREPDKPTASFPAINLIVNGDVHNSTVQVAGSGANQNAARGSDHGQS